MRFHFLAATLIAGIAGLTASSAPARTVPVPDACTNERLAPDDRIAACSAAIQDKASGLNKRNLALYYNGRGVAKYDKSDYAGAVADYSKAIEIHPTAIIYISRGTAHLMLEENEAGIADFTQAIKMDPKNAAGWFGRGYLLNALDQYQDAIADHDQAIRLNPKYALAYADRGYAKNALKDYDGAIADYTQSIRFSPDVAAEYSSRGQSYYEKGDYPNAIADDDKALALDPTLWGAHAFRGLSYKALGDLAKAKSDLAEAVKGVSSTPKGEALLGLARDALASLGEPTPAVATVEEKPATPPPVAAVEEKPAPPVAAPAAAVDAAGAGRRVALVIGNGAYSAVPALPNPKHDAETVAETLRRIGFEVVMLDEDLDRGKFIGALQAFSREARTADWAVVYYGGHGIEMGGMNYLIPVDAELATDGDVEFEAIPLDQVLHAVDGARKLRVVILDACRNNPFANRMQRTSASRSIGRGLARVEPDTGTLVVYSAKDGQTALDGDAGNSPFVTALVARLPTPGMEINKLFRVVRDDVLKATGNQQEPFVYGSLPGEDFFFAGK